jgi:hypothetical protein
MIVCSGDALVGFPVQTFNDGQEEGIHFFVISVGNFESFGYQSSINFESLGVILASIHLYPDSVSEMASALCHALTVRTTS